MHECNDRAAAKAEWGCRCSVDGMAYPFTASEDPTLVFFGLVVVLHVYMYAGRT